MIRRVLLVAAQAGLVAYLSACSRPPEPESPRIDTAEDLQAALRQAGAEFEETAILPTTAGLPGGRVLFVGSERVEIYEQRTQAEQQLRLDGLRKQVWPQGPPNLWGRGRIIVIYDGVDGPTIALLTGLLGDLLDLPGEAAVEPYPPAVAAAVSWLAKTLGVDPGEVAVLEYAPAEWPDACLGLPAPYELCAGVITPGWVIVLEVGGAANRLRTDELGTVIREEP